MKYFLSDFFQSFALFHDWAGQDEGWGKCLVGFLGKTPGEVSGANAWGSFWCKCLGRFLRQSKSSNPLRARQGSVTGDGSEGLRALCGGIEGLSALQRDPVGAPVPHICVVTPRTHRAGGRDGVWGLSTSWCGSGGCDIAENRSQWEPTPGSSCLMLPLPAGPLSPTCHRPWLLPSGFWWPRWPRCPG